MQQQELTDLALDCSLATEGFPMERVVQVFESADMKKGAKGDGSLELAEFLEAIVKLAFARENPSFGSDGSTEVPKPLPGCLETILKDNLLLNAKRDALAEVKAALTTDGPTKQVLAARRDALKSKFDKLVKSSGAKPGAGITMERFCQELFELGVAKECVVQPTSPVKGVTLPEARTNLSLIDVKGAFVTSQKVERNNKASTITNDEFLVCIALCGSIKYGEVKDKDGKALPLAMMVDGIIANFLGEADEAKVVQKLYPPPPRFNPASMSVPGKPAPPPTFMAAWGKMDLSHLWGFPTFESGVFEILEANYGELNSIFSEYAKSGTAGSSNMTALMTIQSTEFTTFALDCGLQTPEFNTTRINNIFTRADQVDDKKKATKVKTQGVSTDKTKYVDQNDQSVAGGARVSEVEIEVMVGDDAKPGDKGLTFPEFLEALVACALFRANPKLGEVGQNDECANPLPDCLAELLKTNILTNAKRDKLALVKSALETDEAILAMMPDIKKLLQKTTPESKSFDDVTKVGVSKVFGKQVMSMDMLQDELSKRRVTKELTVNPTPKVKGDVHPPRHTNLSWLDAKGAFTTAQFIREGRDSAETNEGNETIDFDEFVICLGLIGHIKYEEIDEMSLADRLQAAVDNWLVLKDEQAVIDEHCVPPPPRYDFKNANKLKSMEDKEHQRLIDTYAKMDLYHVFGFPLWEEETFGVLAAQLPRACVDLHRICQIWLGRQRKRKSDDDDAVDGAHKPRPRLRASDREV